MNQRPARIAGWVPISGKKKSAGEKPEIGGLVDVSRTGAKAYLSWEVAKGQILPLGLKLPETGEIVHMPGKVVRVEKDKQGNMENFEARLRLLKDLVHSGHPEKGMTYGWACGIEWDKGVAKEWIRAIQHHFEEENQKPMKRVFLTLKPDLESTAGPPSLRPYVGR